MIHFISRYFYEYHNNKFYWLTRAERRRARLLIGGIAFCIIISVLLWIK